MSVTETCLASSGHDLQRYYRLHSWIYDATRWSFLFGRRVLLKQITSDQSPARILEIGCGTGSNLVRLARAFPKSDLIGIDLSREMLLRAARKTAAIRSRTRLIEQAYSKPVQWQPPPDLIVLSYCLTMINPGWEQVIAAAHEDLASGGRIAVVDFHASSSRAFQRWMACNHVRLDGQLLPALQRAFAPEHIKLHPAYLGLWQYLIFVGAR